MSNLIDLTGMKFKGKLWKNSEKTMRELEILKQNPVWFTDREREQIMADVSAHDFELKIQDYDFNTGLFVASGNDSFGKSGIVGLFEKQKMNYAGIITFEKVYAKEKSASEQHLLPEINFRNSLRKVYFSGAHFLSEGGKTNLSGRYTEPGIKPEFGGQWILDSVSS
jgi:hypothetical protein